MITLMGLRSGMRFLMRRSRPNISPTLLLHRIDLLTYLFKAYAICNDKEFSKFIGDIQTDHDMGTKRVDAMELMALAKKKLKIMKTLNKWEAPSHLEEKILALQAKLEKVQ